MCKASWTHPYYVDSPTMYEQQLESASRLALAEVEVEAESESEMESETLLLCTAHTLTVTAELSSISNDASVTATRSPWLSLFS